MKYLLILSLLLLAILPVVFADESSSAYASEIIVINEFDINPPGDDSTTISEWVELYNPTSSDVDISGWKIASTTVLKKTMTIPSGTVIEPGEFLTYSYDTVWFTDANESVELRDLNNVVIDKTPNLTDIQNDFTSWQRIYDGYDFDSSDDWKFVTSTAGSSNGKIQTPDPEPIIPDGYFVLPMSGQENGDGVWAGEHKAFYENEIATAEISYQYGQGDYPIADYAAIGYFTMADGTRGDDIYANKALVNPGETFTLFYENTQVGEVSEFSYTLLGGDLVLPEPEYAITLNTDRSSYEKYTHGAIEINGQTQGGYVRDTILAEIIAPDGQILFDGTTTVQADGTYHVGLYYSSYIEETGQYTIKVSYFETQAEKTVTVTVPEPTPVPEAEPTSSQDVSVTVSTEKNSYFIDENAIISGSVSEEVYIETPFFQPVPIIMEITGSNYNKNITLYPDEDLNYETLVKLQEILGVTEGIYNVSITYGSATATTSFSVSFDLTSESNGTTIPTQLTATAISSSEIKLSWVAPTETFGQSVSGYEIKREVISGVYDSVGNTNSGTTSFIVTGLQMNKEYTFVVSANIGFGSTGNSNSVTESTFPEVSQQESSITVSGKTITDIVDVTFRIVSPSGNSIVAIAQTSPDSNGNFSHEFPITNIWQEDGFYKISVIHFSITKDFEINVINGIPEKTFVDVGVIGQVSQQTAISVQTDFSSYEEGDIILVTGEVRDLYSGTPVSVILTAPNGNLVSVLQVTVGADKKFSTEIDTDVPTMIVSGTYNITVQYGTPNRSDQTTFYFEGSTATPEPSPINTDNVSISQGSSSPGCEDTFSCYTPYHIKVNAGETITWKNNDSAFHTVTSISSSGKMNGIFESGFIDSGDSFSREFLTNGDFHYFCTLHPWMEGMITVEGSISNPIPETETENEIQVCHNGSTITIPEHSIPLHTGHGDTVGECVLPTPDHDEVTIMAVDGSAAPGCEDTPQGCYLPNTANVSIDGVVIMTNPDSAAHTFTSGTPSEGPSDVFDSGLLMSGSHYEWSPNQIGEFPYFCMVHPWMVGLIIVDGTSPQDIIDDVNDTPIFPDNLPDWVRHIFVWYGQGLVDDEDLIDMIQYLIDEGIIII